MMSLIQQTSFKVLSVVFGSCTAVSGLILIHYRLKLKQQAQKLDEFTGIKLYQVRDLVDLQLQNEKIAVIGKVIIGKSRMSVDKKQKIIYGKSHLYAQNKIHNSEIREIKKNENSQKEERISSYFYLSDLNTHQQNLEVHGIMNTHIAMEACNYKAKIFKSPDVQILPKEGEWEIQNCLTENCPIIIVGNVSFANGTHRMDDPQYICQFQQDIYKQLQQESQELQKKLNVCQMICMVSTSLLIIVGYKSIIQ